MKNEKYMKNMMLTSTPRFSSIYHFLLSEVHQKYAKWVLIGCRLQFPIQQVHLLEILGNPHGDKLKIRKNGSFVFSFFLQKLMK